MTGKVVMVNGREAYRCGQCRLVQGDYLVCEVCKRDPFPQDRKGTRP